MYSLFLNSWLNREGIKRFERKIKSSSWSTRVEARLGSNRSRIDRKFPLDFIEFSPWTPNVLEEEVEQIRFNLRELNPILAPIRLAVRFDQLTGGNFSYN